MWSFLIKLNSVILFYFRGPSALLLVFSQRKRRKATKPMRHIKESAENRATATVLCRIYMQWEFVLAIRGIM